MQQPCLCPPVFLLPCLRYHTPSPCCLSAPSGVHKQVPLQPSLQASSQPGRGRVGQQSQFVENTSAKVVSDHREAVIGALELQGEREGGIRTEGLISSNENRKAPQCSSASLSVCSSTPLSHLVLELIMEVSFLFLGPDHIHDLPVFREAGGAVSITF